MDVAGASSQPEKIRFAPDSALEEAVSSELVSEDPKLPASWENTGNLVDSEAQVTHLPGKNGGESVSYGPIPYAR